MAGPFQQHVHTVRIPTENDDLANMEGKSVRQQAKMVNFTCYRIACHININSKVTFDFKMIANA